MNALVKPCDSQAAQVERVLLDGNLAQLTPDQRVAYYNNVCESLGLNPLTKPFEYITLNSKLTLYAKRDCCEQLRKIHGVSIEIVKREILDTIYVVTARATDRAGRSDESTGAVNIENLKGEARANALMKGETKAKRRVTLSICGLGMISDVEAETLTTKGVLDDMNARAAEAAIPHDTSTGEIIEAESTPASTSHPIGDEVECFEWKRGAKGEDGEWIMTGWEPRRTNEQNKKLHACLKEGGWSDDDKHKACLRYNKESTTQLSVKECGDIIDRMEKKLNRAKSAAQDASDAFEPGSDG